MRECDKRNWFLLGVMVFVLGVLVGTASAIEQRDEIREQKNILQIEVNTYRTLLLEVSQ